MKIFSKRHLVTVITGLAVLLFLTVYISAQTQTEEGLKKKYAPITGEYEFDLSDMGGGVQTLSFYVEGDSLWADSGDGDPAVMEPVEGKEFEFKAEGSEGQSFEISFLKNDQGEYTICKVLIVNMDIEIEGTKIK